MQQVKNKQCMLKDIKSFTNSALCNSALVFGFIFQHYIWSKDKKNEVVWSYYVTQ